MRKYHYVYKITNLYPLDERKYYIGVRSSKVKPEEDVTYWGSSKKLNESIKEIGKACFSKKILSIWKTRKEAVKEEIRLHEKFDVARNPFFYNKAKQLDTKFDTSGFVNVIDIRDNITKQVTKEDYDTFDCYIFITHGKMAALDTRDNKIKQISVEEFKNTEYYVSYTKGKMPVKNLLSGKNELVTVEEYKTNPNFQSLTEGKVTVRDIRDNKIKKVSKEDFDNHDFYVAFSKNMIAVKDIQNGKKYYVSKQEYENNENYVPVQCNHIKIFDETDQLRFESFGSFRKFCKENGLPSSLEISHINGGKKLYQHLDKANIAKLTKNGNIKYKGWYAKKVD